MIRSLRSRIDALSSATLVPHGILAEAVADCVS
jgi:hypothetical protein